MKRLVWIFLAAFCTLLAQVQTVALPPAAHEVCGCCEVKGACGMPDCVPAPSSAGSQLAPARLAQVEVRRVTSPRSAIRTVTPFYLSLVDSPAAVPTLRVAVATASAAQVPLFKAHCSFLI